MSLKILQFPAQGSTRTIRLRAVPEAWAGSYSYTRDLSFLGSWFDDDSASMQATGRLNWGAVSGIALSLTISAVFWAGVGLILERFVR